MKEITIKQATPICDFCSGTPITASYHANDFKIDSLSIPKVVDQHSRGGWAACEGCEKLLDANDWGGLIARVTETFEAKYGNIISREKLHRDFTELYAELRTQGITKEDHIPSESDGTTTIRFED